MKGNRDKALAALLACSSVRAASEYSGISESTLWRYLKEPEFCTILDQRRAETMQRAAAALNEQLESAAQTIQAIMQDNTAPPQTRAPHWNGPILEDRKLARIAQWLSDRHLRWL